MTTEQDELVVDLEAMIDKHGLGRTIQAMSEVCFDKAVHIAEHWQDAELAKLWTKAGQRLAQIKTGL